MSHARHGETEIRVSVNLDGEGRGQTSPPASASSTICWTSSSRHSLIDIELQAKGDLHIDFHHTTEDSGIALGQAISQALGDRAGIQRYGDALIPMDETLTRVALDASNRPYLIWKVAFTRAKLGEMDTELFREWFHAFAQAAGLTLHVENIYGENNHHIIESCYKGLARALRAGGHHRSAQARRRALDQGRARRLAGLEIPADRVLPPSRPPSYIDLRLGNLRSAAKALRPPPLTAAIALGGRRSTEPMSAIAVREAERIVLPGVGAFADCRAGLDALPGMVEALEETVRRKGRPFLGICVGMQLMAEAGLEHGRHPGLGWIAGDVINCRHVPIASRRPGAQDSPYGLERTQPSRPHPLFAGIEDGAHAYFVHSYHLALTNPGDLLAATDYGGPIVAAVAPRQYARRAIPSGEKPGDGSAPSGQFPELAAMSDIQKQATPKTAVEKLTKLSRRDLQELCDAADDGIRAGGGFGWLKPPGAPGDGELLEGRAAGARAQPDRRPPRRGDRRLGPAHAALAQQRGPGPFRHHDDEFRGELGARPWPRPHDRARRGG